MTGRDDKLPNGRRLRPAGHVLVALLVALALAAFFNASAMKRTAQEQPFGTARTVRLAFVEPLATLSHWLLLDRPARLAATALGKSDPALVAVVPAGDKEAPAKPKPPEPPKATPRPTASRPLKIYIAGDSMAGIPGMALTNLARDTGVMKARLDYKVSSGLCRPDFFDWPGQIARQVHAYHPRAAVLMFGANDRQGVQTPSGKVYQFESAGWKKEYRRRVDDVIGELFDGGVRRIYWVGQPIMPDGAFSRQMRVINDIYKRAAKAHPGVQYVDAYSLFGNGSGVYAAYLKDDRGRVEQVREGDGTHFTYAGGVRLAEAVLTRIHADWLPPLRSSVKASPSPAKSGAP